jgi:hypothetical protein
MSKTMRYAVIGCTMVIVCTSSFGDTITFKNGTKLEGIVSQPDPNTVSLDIGGQSITFPATDVTAIEKNDKTGDMKQLAIANGKKHEDAQFERTGLTREQRDRARDGIEPLWSEEESVRNEGRRKLVELNKEMPLAKFISCSLPFSKGYVVPELLTVLTEIDPASAKPQLEAYSTSADPRNRAKSLELMGALKDQAAFDTVARGMIDLEPDVSVSSAYALAAYGEKRATPALLHGLKSNDARVRNVSAEALKTLWKDAGVVPDKPEDWDKLWAENASKVAKPVDVSNMTPLITQEMLVDTNVGHDE